MGIFSDIASIIAIIIFIPILVSSVNRPSESLVYEKDSTRVMHHVINFIKYFILLLGMSFLGFFVATISYVLIGVTLSTVRLLGTIIIIFIGIRKIIFGVQQKKIEELVWYIYFWLSIGVLIIGGNDSPLLSQVLGSLGVLIIIVSYRIEILPIKKKKLNILIIRKYDKLTKKEVMKKRLSYWRYLVMTFLLSSMLFGYALFPIYMSRANISENSDLLILTLGILILSISEILAITQFEAFNLIHDSWFSDERDGVKRYYLESFTDTVIRVIHIGARSQFGEYKLFPIEQRSTTYFPASDLQFFHREDSPIPEIKFF